MTDEALTYEAWDVDYTEQLDDLIRNQEDIEIQLDELISQGEQIQSELATIRENSVNLQYLPHIYSVSALILGTIIAYILFRLVVSFLGRIFSDTSNY